MTKTIETPFAVELEVTDPALSLPRGLDPASSSLLRSEGRVPWLLTRRRGCGASDLASLFNLAPPEWKATPLALYCEKTRPDDDIDEEEEDASAEEPTGEDEWDRDEREWEVGGLDLEPGIAAIAEKRLKVPVIAPPPFSTFRSRAAPWMQASIDRFTVEPDGEVRVLELKSAKWRGIEKWLDESRRRWICPQHVQAQVQGQLFVTGLQRARVVLLAGETAVRFDLERNQGFIDKAVASAAEFMECVAERIPPMANALDYETVARELYPVATAGSSVDLGKWGAQKLLRWDALAEAKRRIDDMIGAVKAEIGERMGKTEVGLTPSGRKFSFKSQRRVTRPPEPLLEALSVLRLLRAGSIAAKEIPGVLDATLAALEPLTAEKVWEGRILLRPRPSKK